jgi:hypothetical protein
MEISERIISVVDFAKLPSSQISKMCISEPIRVPDPHQVEIGVAEFRRGSAGLQSKNAVMIIAIIIGIAQRFTSLTFSEMGLNRSTVVTQETRGRDSLSSGLYQTAVA